MRRTIAASCVALAIGCAAGYGIATFSTARAVPPVAPARPGFDREAFRADIAEGVRAEISRFQFPSCAPAVQASAAPNAAAPSVAATPGIEAPPGRSRGGGVDESPANPGQLANVESLVSNAVKRGRWNEQDRAQAMQQMQALSTRDRLDVMNELARAINSGQVRLQMKGPPL